MQALIERLMSPDTDGAGAGDSSPAAPGAAPVSGDAKEQPVDVGAEPAEEDSAEGPVEDELEEFEFNGQKTSVPKKFAEALRPGLLMQQDYTQKTQTLAQEREAFKAERESFQSIEGANNEIIEHRGKLRQADEMLSRYGQLDWARLRAEADPETVQQRLIEWQQWRDERVRLEGELGSSTQKFQEAQRSDFARRYQEAHKTLRANIPNWDTVAPKVAEYAIKEHGFSAPQLEMAVTNEPRLGKLLHQAWLGHQFSQKQTAPKQQTTPVVVEEKPVTQIGSRGGSLPSKRSLADLAKSNDMDAYVAARKAGRAA